jgi:hypothetical protein
MNFSNFQTVVEIELLLAQFPTRAVGVLILGSPKLPSVPTMLLLLFALSLLA